MERRYFDHLYAEISVAIGHRVSRYDLWLMIWTHGGDPDDLSRDEVQLFVEDGLGSFLTEEGRSLPARQRQRLEATLLRFDPAFPTPEEWASRIGEATGGSRKRSLQRGTSS